MKFRLIFTSLFVVLLASACYGDRRRGSSGSRGGDPGGTPRPGAGTPLCTNGCETANDGFCDDGAAESENEWCDLGTDCNDCGTRYTTSDTRPPSTPSCECDYYTDECDGDCACDPDCDRSPAPTSGGFGDPCECATSSDSGFCYSSDCGSDLECFGISGGGLCTTPCSEFDVGLYEVCPPGGQCQSIDISRDGMPEYLCAPT